MSDFRIDIVGSAAGLESAANQAAGILDGLSSGSVSNFSSSLGGVLGKLGPIGIAAGAALAALTALAAGGAKLAIEFANLSKEFGVNAEAIQKMEKAYGSSGLAAEKLLDINKDAAEKLGEAWNEGTGEFKAALDMVKGDIKDYVAFTNDPEGGRKAAEMWYYQAKAAGLSHSEIIAGMERIASDSSKMIGTLEKSNDFWEHQSKIASESVYVSQEAITAWSSASDNLMTAGKDIMGFFADLFKFVPEGFNKIYSYFKNDFSDSTMFLSMKYIANYIATNLPKMFETGRKAFDPLIKVFDKLRQTMIELYKTIYKVFAKIYNFSKGISSKALGFFGIDTELLNFEMPETWDDLTDKMKENAEKQRKIEEERREEARKTAEEQARLAQEEHERKRQLALQNACPICKKGSHAAADCPEAKKTKDAAKKAADSAKRLREQAYRDLNAINVSLYSSVEASVASSNKQITENLAKLDNALKQGIITQEQYEEKRRALIDANAENFRKSVLGASPADALMMLAASRQVYDQSVADLETMFNNKLIKESEYLQRKKDLEAAFGARTDATAGLQGIKSDELANSFGDRYMAWDEQKNNDVLKATQDYEENKKNINKLPEAERFKQLQALNEAHNKKMREIDLKYNNMRLTDTQNMFGGFGDAMAAFGLESTAIGKGIFAAQKGLSIAQAMINAHEAATKAMATYPGPMGVAMGAASYASAIARVGQMKSIDGMAHDGIDNIPREGTWLLQKGERVVDDRTNGDLKEFLSNQKSGESNVAPIEVHAPLHIAGNVNSADKMVMDAIKRHAHFVAQAVEDAQRRRM